jgi:hypothetical protein
MAAICYRENTTVGRNIEAMSVECNILGDYIHLHLNQSSER